MRISDWSSDVCSSDLLDDGDVTLVVTDRAGDGQAAAQRSAMRLGGAQPQALDERGVDAHACRIACLTGIFGDPLHVHEGRFARLVEMLVGVHPVVPVEHFTIVPGRSGYACASAVMGGHAVACSGPHKPEVRS